MIKTNKIFIGLLTIYSSFTFARRDFNQELINIESELSNSYRENTASKSFEYELAKHNQNILDLKSSISLQEERIRQGSISLRRYITKIKNNPNSRPSINRLNQDEIALAQSYFNNLQTLTTMQAKRPVASVNRNVPIVSKEELNRRRTALSRILKEGHYRFDRNNASISEELFSCENLPVGTYSMLNEQDFMEVNNTKYQSSGFNFNFVKQGSSGLCYANVSSIMYQTAANILEPISYLFAADLNIGIIEGNTSMPNSNHSNLSEMKDLDGGQVCKTFDALKRKGALSAQKSTFEKAASVLPFSTYNPHYFMQSFYDFYTNADLFYAYDNINCKFVSFETIGDSNKLFNKISKQVILNNLALGYTSCSHLVSNTNNRCQISGGVAHSRAVIGVRKNRNQSCEVLLHDPLKDEAYSNTWESLSTLKPNFVGIDFLY